MKEIFIISIAALLACPAYAGEVSLRLPGHRAVYELKLGEMADQQEVVGAAGRYVFDLEDICDGYALNERLVVKLIRSTDAIVTDYRLSAYESESGDLYRFATETDFNGENGKSAKGSLQFTSDGTEISYDGADDLSFGEMVLPPLMHLREVLRTAQAGETRHAAKVFDGDVEKPVFQAVTRISPMPEDTEKPEQDALSDLGSWWLDSVYFPPNDAPDSPVSLPEFSFTGRLFENGIMSELTMNYAEFSLMGTLVELELYDSGY